MTTNTVKLPHYKGHEITFDAHGKRFYVKNLTGSEFMLTCPLHCPRARFGNRKEMTQDIAYALESGALPKSESNVH